MDFVIVDTINKKQFDVTLHNIYASHNVVSVLYAFATGVCFGEPYEKILSGIEKYRTLGIRQNIYDSETGVKLYVDCYNAVGKSVRSAIETASIIPVTGKKIAVIGDIEEAGKESRKIHTDVISIVYGSSFSYLLTYGPKMKEAVENASGNKNVIVKTFSDKNNLCSYLNDIACKGDLVLFKASRKSALESVIEKIWPKSYGHERRVYNVEKIKWRIKIIFS